jgi:hypothetical protein
MAILLISGSRVARIIGVNHRHLARRDFLLTTLKTYMRLITIHYIKLLFLQGVT